MATSNCGTFIVCTILLLADACLAQQRRSKSSSSHSISQVVDFDCPEEFGYYPHPGDCTQYYVCVFGGALLESCTGGLMYSHELQTCDWPRNVGCGESSIESATVSTVQVTDPRTRQTTPIQPLSRSTVSQRQQQQQQQHQLQREEIPKQHQLYAEEDLGPAEEIESDRQQRVYRGQPATLGQVARDRDGLSRHSNALQVSPGVGREKLSVVSFGTQQQYSSDKKTKPPDIDKLLDNQDYALTNELLRPKRQTRIRGSASPATYIEQPTTARVSSSRSYNNTQYNPQAFDSFYNIYDDEADLYKDIEYSQYSGQNNNQQQQQQQQQQPQQQQQQYRSQVYKEKQQPAAVVAQQVQIEQPQQRYSQPSYSAQDIYAQSVNAQDYNDNYNLQNDDIQYKSQLQGKSSASRLEETSTTAVPGAQRQSANQPAPVALRLTDERSPSALPPTPSPTPLPSTSSEPASTPRRLTLSAAFALDNSGASVRRVAPAVPQQRSRGSVKAFSVEDPQSINDGLISAFINDYIDVDSSFEQRRRFNTDNVRTSPSNNDRSEEQQVLSSQTSSRVSTEQPPIIARSKSESPEALSSYNSQGSFRSSQVENRNSRPSSPTFFPSRSETPKANNITEPQQRTRNELNPFRIVVEPTASFPQQEEAVSVNDRSIWRQVKVTNIRSRVMPHRDQQIESQKPESINIQAANKPSETTSENLRTVPIRPRIRVTPKPINEEEVRAVHFIRSTAPPQPAPIELTTPSSPPPPPQTTTTIPSTTTQSRRIIGYRTEEPSFYARLPEENAVNYHDDRRENHLLSKGAGQASFSQNNDNFRDEFEESFSFDKKSNSPISEAPHRQDNSQFISYSKPNIKTYEESDDSVEETNDEKPRSQVSRGRTSSYINPPTFNNRLSTSTPTSIPEPLSNVTESPRFTRPVVRGRGPSPSTSPPSRCPDSQSECNEKPLVRQRPAVPTESPTTASSNPGLSRGSGRTRGSATYTISPNEAEAPPNRGTPASVGRARPTLKPATTIVSKASEYIDIFKYPPSRPGPIYPTPQPDKTAAKCRKDVCLLPDCYCGGKDIPGELLPEETPQIVLLTFDDSVNDLNKQLYTDLFEKGRTNPNGCPIAATFYVSHEWTDYSMVQNLYATGHEMASHSVSHSFGEQFSERKWLREIGGQREILSAYGGVRLEDIRGMRAPFLSVGGNKMFKMLHDGNFTYDSSMPIYENKPPSWPYTLDYKVFHDCMIPPCPTRSYPGVWEVPMVMWQDLNGGRCSMGDACSNPPNADGVYKMLIKNFERHFTSNRAPFGLFYHSAWFTQPHHKEGFIAFLDTIVAMPEVWLVTNWQALQWVRDPTPINRLNNFAPFQCNYPERPRRCNNAKVCNLWHKSGVRYLKTCQPCPEIYPWTGKTGIRNSRVDNDIAQE